MTEISTAYRLTRVSYDKVRHWKKKIESGVESTKIEAKSGRSKSASCKEIVSKIKEIWKVMPDLQFVILHEKKAYHYILKKHLKVRKILTR